MAALHRLNVDLDTYHGVPVIRLHVGDAIPSPRAPSFYALQIGPDLARYLLTFNHPLNRPKKPGKIKLYARDIEAGHFEFTPECLIFGHSGILQNGQNRLYAVIESGIPTWFMVTFGWPDDMITRIDRGSSRTNADGLKIAAVPNPSTVAGALTFYARYRKTVGTPLRWSGSPLTAAEVRDLYEEDPDGWQTAVHLGRATYDGTRGLGPSTWVAAAYILAAEHSDEAASAFMGEVADGSGEVGSATRLLRDRYLRRRLTDTSSGDSREPMENIVRAFNAWLVQKRPTFLELVGSFVLSGVRKP